MKKRRKSSRPPLAINAILTWADAHHRRTGRWPNERLGHVEGTADESWMAINRSLRAGQRGLAGGSSLARLLSAKRGVPYLRDRPPLTIAQILQWADEHFRATGTWPRQHSPRHPAPNESWNAIYWALYLGHRGLSGGNSLVRLFGRHRAVPHRGNRKTLDKDTVLRWADRHHRRTGAWPQCKSGAVDSGDGSSWGGINSALSAGRRGFKGGLSLARLLFEHRGVPTRAVQLPLTEELILTWADSHLRRTGQWPHQRSGIVKESPTLKWQSIHSSLYAGGHGLPGGSSLAELLRLRRGRPNKANLPNLKLEHVIQWAREHHHRTGRWPHKRSGVVRAAPTFTWKLLNTALRMGSRGLPRHTSLARVLVLHCQAQISLNVPRVTVDRILEWADQHLEAHGRWPSVHSGMVLGQSRESWMALDKALHVGTRGLPGGMSLSQALIKHRGKYDPRNPPRLTIKQILAWADAHYQRTGDWPSRQSGTVHGAPNEQWSRINFALVNGRRGLRGPSTLVKVFSTHRAALYHRRGIPLTRDLILEWATSHHEFTGALPTMASGPVRGIDGENWKAIDASLRTGSRNLKGRPLSLADFLERHYVEPYPNTGRRLSARQIISWAEDFRTRTGFWPTARAAYVTPPGRGKDGEKWAVIDAALREGLRGLPGGSSLQQLRRTHRSASRSNR